MGVQTNEVTNVGSDRSQLANTAQAAQPALEMESLEVVADRGYRAAARPVGDCYACFCFPRVSRRAWATKPLAASPR